jgi:RNA polymerase sigma factor (sigma-70 family)
VIAPDDQASDGSSETAAESIGELFRRLRPRLAAVLASHKIPPEDAEDLLQESILALLRRWDATRSPEDYLLGILRYQCATYIRDRYEERRQLLQVEPRALDALLAAGPQPQDALARRLDLASASQHLSVQQSCVLVLRWLGYTHREIGEACGRETAAVRQDAARAIERLQAAR